MNAAAAVLLLHSRLRIGLPAIIICTGVFLVPLVLPLSRRWLLWLLQAIGSDGEEVVVSLDGTELDRVEWILQRERRQAATIALSHARRPASRRNVCSNSPAFGTQPSEPLYNAIFARGFSWGKQSIPRRRFRVSADNG